MAWIPAETTFHPEEHSNGVIGIATQLNHHDSGLHLHNMGQLLFSQQGCMRVTINSSMCILPPTRVAWIPAQVVHRVQIRGHVSYRSIYLNEQYLSPFSDEVEVLSTTPLLRELLERVALAHFRTDWSSGAHANILAVFMDELSNAKREISFLPFPQDRRLRCLKEIEPPPLLQVLASYSGASEKTISRIMNRETGVSYQQWRQQWRLFKAIELLSSQHSLTDVASKLEFASTSAFITFFRNMTGESPRLYMAMLK